MQPGRHLALSCTDSLSDKKPAGWIKHHVSVLEDLKVHAINILELSQSPGYAVGKGV